MGRRSAILGVMISALAVWAADAALVQLSVLPRMLIPFAVCSDPVDEMVFRLVLLGGAVAFASLVGPMTRWVAARRVAGRQLDRATQSLLELMQLTSTERDRSALVTAFLRQLTRHRRYKAAWVILLDPEGRFEDAAEEHWGSRFDGFCDDAREGRLPDCLRAALEESGPIVVTDTVQRCKGCALRPRRYGRGSLVIRLAHGTRVFGALCVSASPRVVADDAELVIVQTLAGGLAFALHDIELEGAHGTSSADLERTESTRKDLTRLAMMLPAPDEDLDSISQAVLRSARFLTKARHGFVSIVDPLTRDVVSVATTADEVDARSETPPPSSGSFSLGRDGRYPEPWGKALNDLATVCENCARPKRDIAATSQTAPGKLRLTAAPVLAGRTPLGIVTVYDSERELDERDTRNIACLADLYSTAVQRFRSELTVRVRGDLIEASEHAVVTTDLEGNITHANATFLEWWNYDQPNEILGRPLNWLWRSPEESREILASLAKRGSWSGELKARRRDASLFDASVSAIAVPGVDGSAIQYAAWIKDLTSERYAKETRRTAFEIARIAATAESPLEAFRAVQGELENVMKARNLFVAYWDEQSDVLSFPHFVDEKDQGRFTTVPAEKTFTGHVVKTGDPLLAPRPVAEEMIESDTTKMVGTPAACWMGAPLRLDGRVVGAVVVQSYDEPDDYDEGHLAFLSFASEQLGLCIARHDSEVALRESDGRLSAVSQTTSDAHIEVDGRGTILSWNDSARSMFGYSADEAVGKPFSLVVPEGFLQAHLDGLRKAVSAKGPGYVRGSVEGVGLRKDGSQFPMELSVGAWRTDSETYFTALVRDVTAAKQAEEELQFLGSIPLQVSDALIVTDLNYRINYVNRAAEELYSYSGDELIGKTLDILSAEAWDPEFREEIHTTVASGRVWSGTLPNRRKDGSAFVVEFRVSPLRDRQGRLTSYITILHDITERTRAELLLQSLNAAALAMERHMTPRDILSAVAAELDRVDLSCAIFLVAPEQDAVSLTHLSRGDGTFECLERQPEDAGDVFAIAVDGSYAFSETVAHQKTVFLEDTKEITDELSAEAAKRLGPLLKDEFKGKRAILAPLMKGSDVLGVLSVHSGELTRKDAPAITAFANQLAAAWRKANAMGELESALDRLRKTQDQLLHAQKMEAVGNLAGGVAHDFNNLLTAINGYAELLLARLKPKDPNRGDVEQIRKAAKQAAALTSQLLAFSRRQPLQPKVLSLNEVILGTEKMLRRLIGEDIELVTVLDPDTSLVKADPAQVEQVVMNLALNARDAMPNGGTITIRTENAALDKRKCRSIRDARPGTFVRLCVEDNGCGMSTETVERIFEPFFSTKEIGKGTGLGLSVVYGIVSQHDGWINVASEPGDGTAFQVYFPVASDAPEPVVASEQDVEIESGRGEKILLVEDEDAVRAFVKRALTDSGYDVVEAATAEEAIVVFGEGSDGFDAVFSDVVLPGKSGVQLVDELLDEHPDLCVVLCSGYADQKSHWAAIRERGFSFLQKPYATGEMLRTLREALDSH